MNSTQRVRLLKIMATGEKIRYKLHLLLLKLWWRVRAKFILLRLPKDLNLYLRRWQAIDRRKDKSLSATNFRFWLYNRLCNNE